MRSLLLATLVVVLPLTAAAQSGAQSAAPRAETIEPFISLTREQAVSVGYSLVAGAVVTQFLFGGMAATAAGIVGGALFGAWWHDQYSKERTAIRAGLPAGPQSPRR